MLTASGIFAAVCDDFFSLENEFSLRYSFLLLALFWESSSLCSARVMWDKS